MTADEVKQRLRSRHPATQMLGTSVIPGPWTTVEEWMEIDFLAISAHARPASGALPGVRYPRIGYEVKISRGDLRRELLAPRKRAKAVAWCNAFYFAVPKGLLSKDELAFEEPDAFRDWRAFSRKPCTNHCQRKRSGAKERVYFDRQARKLLPCQACEGRGYSEPSLAEQQAPTLWVPRDVGLVEVSESSCRVVRQAPVRRHVPAPSPEQLADLLRWVSVRPDPRHRRIGRG